MGPGQLLQSADWQKSEQLLTERAFLEAKAEAGMVFELAADFTAAAERLNSEDHRRRWLRLIEEAIRRDIQFMAGHPTTLFQCLWNMCWWFDSPEAASHYQPPRHGSIREQPPWESSGPKLAHWLESWRRAKEQVLPDFIWLRSLRPPSHHLGIGQKAVMRGHEGEVSSVAFSPDGRFIASGSGHQTVRVWDAATGAQICGLRGHQTSIYTRDSVNSVTFSPDSRRIASGSRDGTVRIWDAHSRAEIFCLRGHGDEVFSVAFYPDSQRILSGSKDGTVRIWDTKRGTQLLCLELDKAPRHSLDSYIRHFAFSPNGQLVAGTKNLGSDDLTIVVWDATSGTAESVSGLPGLV